MGSERTTKSVGEQYTDLMGGSPVSAEFSRQLMAQNERLSAAILASVGGVEAARVGERMAEKLGAAFKSHLDETALETFRKNALGGSGRPRSWRSSVFWAGPVTSSDAPSSADT